VPRVIFYRWNRNRCEEGGSDNLQIACDRMFKEVHIRDSSLRDRNLLARQTESVRRSTHSLCMKGINLDLHELNY